MEKSWSFCSVLVIIKLIERSSISHSKSLNTHQILKIIKNGAYFTSLGVSEGVHVLGLTGDLSRVNSTFLGSTPTFPLCLGKERVSKIDEYFSKPFWSKVLSC